MRPLVIQSLFMRVAGEPPTPAELDAFCDRLNEITAAGGQLKLVQVYTVARRPAESFVAPLTDAEVDAIVALVERRTGLRGRGVLRHCGVLAVAALAPPGRYARSAVCDACRHGGRPPADARG